MEEERFRAESASSLHAPTPVLSRAGHFHVPEAPTVARVVLLEQLNQIPIHVQEAGWAPGALGMTARGGAPGAGAGLGISEGSSLAGRVPSLHSPPRGATGAWGTWGQPDPTPRALSFCTRRGGQGIRRVESTAGWAGLPRVKGPQKLQPRLDTPRPPASSPPHPSLCLPRAWHRSELMGPKPQLR